MNHFFSNQVSLPSDADGLLIDEGMRLSPVSVNDFAELFSGLQQCSSIEPTPINPEGSTVVDQMPFDSAPWRNNKNFMDVLQGLLKNNEGGLKSCHSISSFPSQQFLTTSFNGIDTIQKPARRNSIESLTSSIMRELNGDDTTKKGVRRPSSESFTSRGSQTSPPTDDSTSTRNSHSEQWKQRYQELKAFQQEYGHCLVPLNWPYNPSLAHWIKRQRYQYRMKKDGKHSTMTRERQSALESLGFVWDSHAASWEEKWEELRDFKDRHHHCNVPKTYAQNPQLAIWVKCQRRQFKLYSQGKNSTISSDRIEKLLSLGFIFTPRPQKTNKTFDLDFDNFF